MEKAIKSYSKRMQFKLEKNAHKACPKMNSNGEGVRGWDTCPQRWLLKRAKEELKEAEDALKIALIEGTTASIINYLNELADVGNFCAMAHDNFRGETLAMEPFNPTKGKEDA